VEAPPPEQKPPPPRRRRRPPPEPEPPPPEPPPPEPEPPPVMKFAYEMGAGPGGRVALPTGPGGSRVGAVDGVEGGSLGRRFGEGQGERESGATGDERAEVVEATEATTQPRLVAQPSAAELRRAYPAAARENGLEADVLLRVLVGQSGRVEQVSVVRRAGNGFDEAAEELARRLRFRPGRRGGRTVAVWVTFPFRFRLDG
jgi:periplasmic protein TonB